MSAGIQIEEWNFSNVPLDELLPCCNWEYARESARIKSVFDQDDETYFPPSIVKAKTQSRNGVTLKTNSVINMERARFISSLREFALPVFLTYQEAIKEFSRPLDLPWVKLSETTRRKVIEELAPYFAEKPALTFLPFNRCSDLRDIGLADEEYRCAEIDEELGVERLRVEIDWGGFTDMQIIAAFKTWIAENRPRGIGSADHRGRRKTKGYGDYLAWLGIMRLMHTYPFTSIERELPNAWSFYRSADWPRARKKAGKVFFELFHFLPAEDSPIHWQTAGGRAK